MPVSPPNAFPWIYNPPSTGGGGGGSGGSGGGGSRDSDAGGGDLGNEVQLEITETAVSAEVPITIANPTSNALQINWSKYAGSDGYRVFFYQKDAQQQAITNSFYRDVDRSQLSLLWAHPEGAIQSAPTFQNDFRVIAIGTVKRKVDLDGNASTIQRLGSYVKNLLKSAGKTDDELDLPSFQAVDDEYDNDEIRQYIDSPAAIGAWINNAEVSAIGFVKQNENGKLGFYLTDPLKEPAAEFTEIDYRSPVTSKFQRANTFNKVRLNYDHSAIDGAFQTVEIDVQDATYRWVQNEVFEVASIFVDKATNRRIALLWAAHLKQQQLQISLPVRSKGFVVSVGDVISISKARGFKPDGEYSSERWLVFNLSRNMEQATAEILGVQPFREIEKVRVWAPDSVPAWGSASAEEKETYGFWADDNGLVDSVNRQALWGPR